MWTCRQCGMAVPAQALEPEQDADGYYFACPRCGARNRLINTAQDEGDSDAGLTQPDA